MTPTCDLESIAAWYARYAAVNAQRLEFFGVPVVLDGRMPHDVLELRDSRGRVCGKIRLAKDWVAD